jgi:hypothetical protein
VRFNFRRALVFNAFYNFWQGFVISLVSDYRNAIDMMRELVLKELVGELRDRWGARMWGCAVWIEINRDQVGSNLISPTELKNRWESEKAYRLRTMPGIEAAYMGVLPRTAFKRAFVVRKEDAQLHPLEI